MRYRYGGTLYNISVSRNEIAADGYPDATTVSVDGIAQAGNVVLLVDDGNEHRVDVRVAAEQGRTD